MCLNLPIHEFYSREHIDFREIWRAFLELPIFTLLAPSQLWPLGLPRYGNYLGLEGDTLYIFFQPNLVIFIIFGVKSI